MTVAFTLYIGSYSVLSSRGRDCTNSPSLANAVRNTAKPAHANNFHYITKKGRAGILAHLKCYQRIIVNSNENVTEGAISDDEKMSIDERRNFHYITLSI